MERATQNSGMNRGARPSSRAGNMACGLASPGWDSRVRRGLERLIEQGAGRGLPVVFDFDNTLVCGDIGEATLAVLVRDGLVRAGRLSDTIAPAFSAPGRGRVTRRSGGDATAYYEALLSPTAHGARDPAPLANAYVWAVEAMAGLRLGDVVEATRTACAAARPPGGGCIEVSPGGACYPAPFFYPEMVELLAHLLRRQFDVWIVSASNVWSVRGMVREELNPRLRARGVSEGVRPERVIGISTLLSDARGRLYKDAVLVREDADYAALKAGALRRFSLTRLLQFPVPVYSGKVACLWDPLQERPYLAAGDSPGDHAMLAYSRHRLWLARLDKPAYQEQTAALVRRTGASDWLFQAVLTGEQPGFVPDLRLLAEQPGAVSPVIRQTAAMVEALGRGRRARGRS